MLSRPIAHHLYVAFPRRSRPWYYWYEMHLPSTGTEHVRLRHLPLPLLLQEGPTVLWRWSMVICKASALLRGDQRGSWLPAFAPFWLAPRLRDPVYALLRILASGGLALQISCPWSCALIVPTPTPRVLCRVPVQIDELLYHGHTKPLGPSIQQLLRERGDPATSKPRMDLALGEEWGPLTLYPASPSWKGCAAGKPAPTAGRSNQSRDPTR